MRSTVWADSRKGSPGRLRICAASSCGAKGSIGGGSRCGEDGVGAEGSGLDGDEARAGLADGSIVGVELALQELADEDRALRGIAGVDGDDVRDEHLAEAGGERGREVADLIGVREDDECGVRVLDELLERGDEAVRRVGLEQGVIDAVDLVELLGGELGGERGDAFAASENGGGAGCAERWRRAAGLRRGLRSSCGSSFRRAVRGRPELLLRSYHPHLKLQFFNELRGDFRGRAGRASGSSSVFPGGRPGPGRGLAPVPTAAATRPWFLWSWPS